MGRTRGQGNDNLSPSSSDTVGPSKRRKISKENAVPGEVEPEGAAASSTPKKISKGNGRGERVENAILQSMRGCGTDATDEIAFYQRVMLELTGDMKKLKRITAAPSINKLKRTRSLHVDYTMEHWEYLTDSDDEDEGEDIWRGAKDSFELFNNNIKLLLEQSGDQVLRFQFSFWRLDEVIESLKVSFSQIYLLLRDFLQLMPNLKWLVLQLDNSTRRFSSIWNTLSEMEDVEVSVLQNQKMPTLTLLERVDFEEKAGCYNVLTICNAILNSNPHVKYHFHDTENYLQHHLSSPPVLALALEEAKIANEWFDKVDIPFLQKISTSSCNWNLKKLTLWTNARDGSIQDIFQFLGRFPQLEKLELHVDNAVVGEGAKFPQLESLTILKMEVGPDMKFEGTLQYFFSLGFLETCRNLKKFKWRNLIHFEEAQKIKRKLKGAGDGIMTDFKGGFEDLSGSNIWDKWPGLESLDVSFLRKKEDPVDGRELTRMKYLKRKLISNQKEWFEGAK